MSILEIDQNNKLYYLHEMSENLDNPTFVFVNALTGDTDTWETYVAPTLKSIGFGTLSYDYRGQKNSSFSSDIELTQKVIVKDLQLLLNTLEPTKPILVGLSIGGLFAAHAVLQGTNAYGLVLLNTLRKIGPRIAWVNDALPELVSVGGISLFLDALFPLLVNQDFADQARPNFLKGQYHPLSPTHGHVNLMRNAKQTVWDIEYEKLTLPTLVITGLQDRVFLDLNIVNELFCRLPNAQREDWGNAGHLLPQERPKELSEALAKFANSIKGS